MMPFQNLNPNYFAQYPQLYQQTTNPYMQRLENLQQFQQTLQPQIPFSPLGKVVESMDMVKVTDIPMDGNAYYFPKADGTEIYSKQFMPNGQTRILTFKPLLEDNTENSPQSELQGQIDGFNEVLRAIQEDIKALGDKVDKITKPNKTKKEVIEDE